MLSCSLTCKDPYGSVGALSYFRPMLSQYCCGLGQLVFDSTSIFSSSRSVPLGMVVRDIKVPARSFMSSVFTFYGKSSNLLAHRLAHSSLFLFCSTL
jgi:hypothetical protein